MLPTHEVRVFACLLESKCEVLVRLDRASRELTFMREGAWKEIGRVVPDATRTLRLCRYKLDMGRGVYIRWGGGISQMGILDGQRVYIRWVYIRWGDGIIRCIYIYYMGRDYPSFDVQEWLVRSQLCQD